MKMRNDTPSQAICVYRTHSAQLFYARRWLQTHILYYGIHVDNFEKQKALGCVEW